MGSTAAGVAEGVSEGETAGVGELSLAGDSFPAAAVDAAGAERSCDLSRMPKVRVSTTAARTKALAERTDRLDDPTASVRDGGGSDSEGGVPDGAVLGMLAASRLSSSGRPAGGTPASSEGEAPRT